MALYRQYTSADYSYAVWRMDESVEQLLSQIDFPDYLIEESSRFKSPHRQLEWLSVRALLYTMTGQHIHIYYMESGKPYIEDGYISISHTKGYVAVAYSKRYEVAIDIEHCSDRVRKVASRFMHPDEVPSLYEGSDISSLLLHWSGKETVYKLVGYSAVDFRESIRIHPFTTLPSGTFTADAVVAPAVWQSLTVSYLLEQDYVITWCVYDTSSSSSSPLNGRSF